MDGEMDKWMGGQRDGWTDGWMGGWITKDRDRHRPCWLFLWKALTLTGMQRLKQDMNFEGTVP